MLSVLPASYSCRFLVRGKEERNEEKHKIGRYGLYMSRLFEWIKCENTGHDLTSVRVTQNDNPFSLPL